MVTGCGPELIELPLKVVRTEVLLALSCVYLTMSVVSLLYHSRMVQTTVGDWRGGGDRHGRTAMMQVFTIIHA